MSGHLETLAIIPARGGSQGIPSKNIQDLCGKPLIAYTIETARASCNVDRVIVSTDDEKIAVVSKKYGAEIPFMRPREISGSRSLIGEAIEHVLQTLREREGYCPDLVMIMYPTHPFRPAGIVDLFISKIDQGYRAAITVRLVVPEERIYVTISRDGGLTQTRQQNPPAGKKTTAYRKYGLLEALRVRPVYNFLGSYIHPIHDPISLIDIDDLYDLELARKVMAKHLFSFESV
jgi:CMP-N,N'-diacetyllegionaminic acid synthase